MGDALFVFRPKFQVMEELEILAKQIRASFELKKIELLTNGKYDPIVRTGISEREKDILGFEEAIKNVDDNPAIKKLVIKNFREAADVITERIREI